MKNAVSIQTSTALKSYVVSVDPFLKSVRDAIGSDGPLDTFLKHRIGVRVERVDPRGRHVQVLCTSEDISKLKAEYRGKLSIAPNSIGEVQR